MQASDTFNWQRLILLLQKDFLYNRRIIAIVSGVLSAFFVLVGLYFSSDPSGNDGEYFYTTYGAFILVGGFILSSYAFYELTSTSSREHYLTLPASNLEKFISKWLITVPIFIILGTLVYWVLSLLLNFLCGTIDGFQFIPFNPFKAEARLFPQLYFSLQSLFLLGAVTFRKFSIFKTPLFILAGVLAFALITVTSFHILFFDLFDGLFSFKEPITKLPDPNFLDDIVKFFFEKVLWWIFVLVLPAVIWTTTYFKIKEKEV